MRLHQPRTLDDVLARARINGDYTPGHRAASRRRITDQLLELRWINALTVSAGTPSGPAPDMLLHEQAEEELRAVS
ncbi:hypothetical protein ABZX69_37690 [Streptomyces sp. NPDC004074]